MSMFAAMLILIPPVPGPPPWRPAMFPEYTAMCHVIDAAGTALIGNLTVSGQDEDRTLKLGFDQPSNWPSQHMGQSFAMVHNQVTDGTYSFTENLLMEKNPQRFEVSLRGLGPSPHTLSIKINAPSTSPVFEQPGLVGICTTTSVSKGTPYSSANNQQDQPK